VVQTGGRSQTYGVTVATVDGPKINYNFAQK
jgi:hypothetical protein